MLAAKETTLHILVSVQSGNRTNRFSRSEWKNVSFPKARQSPFHLPTWKFYATALVLIYLTWCDGMDYFRNGSDIEKAKKWAGETLKQKSETRVPSNTTHVTSYRSCATRPQQISH